MSKQKKQTSQRKTNNQVANSNIGYQGVVTITTYKGKQRKSSFSQKNEGTQSLFNFIASCLSGQLKENGRPNFIQLLGASSNTLTKQPQTGWEPLTSPIKAVKAVTGTDSTTQANITYSFLVPYFMLNTAATRMYIYRAQLLNSLTGEDAICASADVKVPNGFERPFLDTSSPDYSLVIDWKLSIANNETTNAPTTPTEGGEQ